MATESNGTNGSNGNSKKRQQTAARIIKALKDTQGLLTIAAPKAGVSYTTINRYVADFPSVKEAAQEARERMLDFAEGKLYTRILKGDSASILFFLKTQGKNRGYIERQEIGKPGRHQKNKGFNGGIKSYKFDDIKKENYLEFISNGSTRGYAASLVGISRATVCDHMKDDKTFAEAVSDAEGDASGKVVNALHDAATSGNVTAIQVWLYNRDPKNWADKRNIQLSGKDGGPIEYKISVVSKNAKKLLDKVLDGEGTD